MTSRPTASSQKCLLTLFKSEERITPDSYTTKRRRDFKGAAEDILCLSNCSDTTISSLTSVLNDTCRKRTGTFWDLVQELCGLEIYLKMLIQTEPLLLGLYGIKLFSSML